MHPFLRTFCLGVDDQLKIVSPPPPKGTSLPTLVDRHNHSNQRGPTVAPVSAAIPHDGCFAMGMGSPPLRILCGGSVAGSPTVQTHQFPQTSSNFLGPAGVSTCPVGSSDPSFLRQHHSCRLPKQAGRSCLQISLPPSTSDMGLLHCSFHHSCGNSPTRSAKYHCRCCQQGRSFDT